MSLPKSKVKTEEQLLKEYSGKLAQASIIALGDIENLRNNTASEKIRIECNKIIMEAVKTVKKEEVKGPTFNFNFDKFNEGIGKLRKIGGSSHAVEDKAS